MLSPASTYADRTSVVASDQPLQLAGFERAREQEALADVAAAAAEELELLIALDSFPNGLEAEAIDQGMKLGCGHPMGPLTLLDLVGIDTTYYIANIMFDEFREPRFAPPPLMKRMVLAGFNGRKTGKGFYDYASEPPRPNDFLAQR